MASKHKNGLILNRTIVTFILKIFFTIIVIMFAQVAQAQKLTGTWEGEMEGYEFLQLNIVQIGNNLCGYSWDYELSNKKSYCKAYFSGKYSKLLNEWFVEGSSFMEQGGGHVLMQLKFKIQYEEGKMVLKGSCRIKPSMFFAGGDPNSFVLQKTSSRPTIITQTMKDCMATFQPAEKPFPKITASPKKEIPITKKPPVINKSKTLPPIVTVSDIKDSVAAKQPAALANTLPVTTNGRVDKELRRIVVHDKKITLNIYDNGTIDGDTISIYYNGRPILKNKGLTAKPLVVEIELDENIALHSIVLFAENLGSIPPNTALVVFTTSDGKRYELYSSTTLQQNASIVFEYKPK